MTVMSGRAFPSILDPEVGRDPHAHYARLRAEGPAYLDTRLSPDRCTRYGAEYPDPTIGAYHPTTSDGACDAHRYAPFPPRGCHPTLETIHARTVLSLEGSLHAKPRALLTTHFRGKALDALNDEIHPTAA